MGSIADSLKRYFEETSKTIIDQDWEQIKIFNEIGPDAFDYIEYIKAYCDYIEPHEDAYIFPNESESFQTTECKYFMAA